MFSISLREFACHTHVILAQPRVPHLRAYVRFSENRAWHDARPAGPIRASVEIAGFISIRIFADLFFFALCVAFLVTG